MKYSRTKMEKLVKNDPELSKRLKQIIAELDLEKSFALKALYHADVKDGGTHQSNYQDL